MLGQSVVNQNQTKLAIPYLMRAAELAADDAEIRFHYGLALAQAEYIKEAEVVFHAVLQLEEKHADAHYNLGVIAMFYDKPEEALVHFKQALEIQPNHVLAANAKNKVEEAL